MPLLHPQLSCFAMVIEEHSFEAAARRLSITPSAVSQRIKALEARTGQVLVIRGTPCRPTPAGEKLLQRLRPMQRLEAEAMAELSPAGQPPPQAAPVPLAVNDDSLETWFLPALAALHRDHGYLFELRVDDQEHTLEWLRKGRVLGAVTAQPQPLQGCGIRPLGCMRYRAIAAPAYIARHFPHGMDSDSLRQAPLIAFNRKDALQARFVREICGADIHPPGHYLPTSLGFVEAARLGMGWCLAPEAMIGLSLERGDIAVLEPDRWLDVPLYWQYLTIKSDTLARIGRQLAQTAASRLIIA